mmetsp:Transcript_5398/g.11974  ORF Transcript_5398/g.11974 Transcript_5398/m.11974 type:complete len:230 (+) Transcript_5398:480-1169(+)
MRCTNDSPARPSRATSAPTRWLKSGMRRSASACARPQRGKAGHAIDLRVKGSMSSMGFTPCASSSASMAARSAGFTPASTTFWCGVSRTSTLYVSTTLRSAVLSRNSPSSLTRPCSTLTPRNRLPSPCSCQPSQSTIFHAGRGTHGCTFLPEYDSTSVRKLSMPMVWTRYFSRALARTSRLPWSRHAARIPLSTSLMSSLGTNPRWSAARAKVDSLLLVRPMPPPTRTS